MEENNDYYINSKDLDFILKKMIIFFNESEKDKIIKAINSASINNVLETSDFDDYQKIQILKIYLEWKNYILQKKININKNYKENNNEDNIHSNQKNNIIDNDTNEIYKNKISKISDKISKIKKKYNINKNRNTSDQENTNNNILYEFHNINYDKNDLNKFKIYTDEEENTINYLEVSDELLEKKFKILNMRLEMINILKYENKSVIDEIHTCKENYILDKEIIEKYREKNDIKVMEERDIQDVYYEKKYKYVIESLIEKYIENTENIKEYINETIDFYQKYINEDKKYLIEKLPSYKTNMLNDKNDENNIQEKQLENVNKMESNKETMKNVFQKLRQNTKDYDNKEIEYFQKLTNKRQNEINQIEEKIKEINLDDIPIRFQVLEKNLSIENKAMIINKLNEHKKNKYLSDSAKYFTWLHGLLKIPFGEYIKLPITCNNSKEEIKAYLDKSKEILDSAVYGHQETKENIIQLIAQWISNPSSSGNVIGIQGPMGNGKTTLVKDGIAKAIQRPFEFISLGGSSDSSYLNGHSYTYEGAIWGQIVNVLINSNCMNPVFYFDELDKVSNTPKGEEIINLLIHITDATQNTKFQDRYFSGIDIDLSRAVFIFSYNDIEKINPILLDRFIQIKTNGFEVKDKINIFKQFLYKNISNNLGIKKEVNFSDEIIKIMIEKYTDEKGVRNLNKIIYAILSKINLSILTQSNEYIDTNGNININEQILKNILKDKNNVNYVLNSMYI